jgi:hypothetical protein
MRGVVSEIQSALTPTSSRKGPRQDKLPFPRPWNFALLYSPFATVSCNAIAQRR